MHSQYGHQTHLGLYLVRECISCTCHYRYVRRWTWCCITPPNIQAMVGTVDLAEESQLPTQSVTPREVAVKAFCVYGIHHGLGSSATNEGIHLPAPL